jgi:hypothetical protein
MHRSSFRLALSLAAALAASTSLAVASTGEDAAPKEKRIQIHKIPGPGHGVFIAGLPGENFEWRGTILGVAFVPLTPELRQHFGAPEDAGVLVSKVVSDSAAQAAGVEVGDIITKVDGEAIGEGFALGHAIRSRKAGDTISLEVLRDGRVQTLSATLKESAAPMAFERRAIMMDCKDGDGENKECPPPAILSAIDCGGEGKCEVRVICKDQGDCTCTINGDDKPCPEGVGHQGGQ